MAHSDLLAFWVHAGRQVNLWWPPDQRRTLSKLPTELRRRNLADEHPTGRASRRQKCKKTCAQRARVPTGLPSLHAAVGGWVSEHFARPTTRTTTFPRVDRHAKGR